MALKQTVLLSLLFPSGVTEVMNISESCQSIGTLYCMLKILISFSKYTCK
jgi:hypothetical protein